VSLRLDTLRGHDDEICDYTHIIFDARKAGIAFEI
jgi:hypothetical protein